MIFRTRLCFAATACALFLGCPALRAQPQDVHPIRSGAMALPLNGTWQFRYLAGSNPGEYVGFHSPSFAGASAWKTIPVPGHWELHGFAEPKYAQVAEGLGLYRRIFRIPAAWSGQRLFLRFEGVLHGFEAWVNGRSVGTWGSAYNPVTFDVTDAINATGDNLLAVQVTTRNKGFDFDLNDCWALSGIYREVTLFAVPPAHLKDFTTRTTLAPDGSATLDVEVVASAAANATGRLLSPQGELVREFPIALEAGHRGAASVSVSKPQLWTAETPSLYRLEIALQSGGKTVQEISAKIGLRQVTIDGGVLKLNGSPIKLRGVNHHDIWPDEGRVATEELMRRDLTLMRAANINFVRTSHYPPHPRLLELCDELGFYVMDEVPFGFGDAHLRDESYQEILFTRARATLMRDKNHASVIIWSVGNENPNTPLTFATGKRVKELDPTRPICFPQVGSYFERSHQELPEWVDIYAPHYPVVKTLQRYATELKRPVIVTEYAHALGLATDRIQEEWEIMQANPHFAGGAVWMFQDQGIRRTAEKPTDLAAPSLYAWPDATHYYDTGGNGGMDGLVYSDRTPQTDYWQVRKVYSPVQIAGGTLTARPGEQTFSIKLENRFDFRALTGHTLAWSLRKNGEAVQQGSVPLTTAARASETLSIAAKIPEDLKRNFYSLELRCLDEAGHQMTEQSLRLQPEGNDTPWDELLNLPREAPPLDLTESPGQIRAGNSQSTLTVNRQTGTWSLRNAANEEVARGGYPHVGRRFTEAEALRAKTAGLWTGAFLDQPVALEVESKSDGCVEVTIRGKYPRAKDSNEFLEGEQQLCLSPRGWVIVRYSYRPVNATGGLLEAGLSLVLGERATQFRWIGQGPFPGYPGKDRLNILGIHHLTSDDLNFQGNRREVSLATFTDPDGTGVLLATSPAPQQSSDVAVEKVADGLVVSHNALLSGRGNKGVGPEKSIDATKVDKITGEFFLIPLSKTWPSPLVRLLGPAQKTVPANRPFFRSFDQ